MTPAHSSQPAWPQFTRQSRSREGTLRALYWPGTQYWRHPQPGVKTCRPLLLSKSCRPQAALLSEIPMGRGIIGDFLTRLSLLTLGFQEGPLPNALPQTLPLTSPQTPWVLWKPAFRRARKPALPSHRPIATLGETCIAPIFQIRKLRPQRAAIH